MALRLWGLDCAPMLTRAAPVVLMLYSSLSAAADDLPPPPPPPPVEPLAPPPPPPSAPETVEPGPEGELPPRGFHYENVRRKGALIGGAVVFGVGYLLSNLYGIGCATGGVTSGLYRGGGNALYLVPVLGPLLRQGVALSGPIGSIDSSFGYNVVNAALDVFLTVVFTTAEAVGLAFTLVGLFKTSRELVPDDPLASREPEAPRWVIAPVGPSGTPGLSFALSF